MSPAQPPAESDLVVVGGGILGLAVARELRRRRPDRELTVLEAAPQVGSGQTGANSGVIHAGIYYAPGSLKARMCVAGARLMYDYCEEHGIPFERCGKLIVARDESELGRLDELERRGTENEVPGLRRLTGPQIPEVEPHARGAAALHSPETGIVDFGAVARSLATGLEKGGTSGRHRLSRERLEPAPPDASCSPTRGARPPPASRCSAPAARPTVWPWPPGPRPTPASCPSAAPTSISSRPSAIWSGA